MAEDAASAGRLRIAVVMDPGRTPDLLAERHWDDLERIGTVLCRRPIADPSEPDALGLLASADVLLTGWGCPQLDAGLLSALPRLRLVAHAASSVKPIVSDVLWSRAIRVSSAAAANAVPVAEFALAAILLVNKQAFSTREAYRATGRPPRYPWTMPGCTGNFGAVVGIVGASRTGRRLIELLRPFDLAPIVYDPVAAAQELAALGAESVPLLDLARRADIVSIHAPSLPETRALIGREFLAAMRNGATLINTARGEIVDHAALEAELVCGRLNAVLDVTDPEPLPPDSPVLRLPNAFVTPHIAGAAGAETQRLADTAISEIRAFAADGTLRHEVTRDMLARIG